MKRKSYEGRTRYWHSIIQTGGDRGFTISIFFCSICTGQSQLYSFRDSALTCTANVNLRSPAGTHIESSPTGILLSTNNFLSMMATCVQDGIHDLSSAGSNLMKKHGRLPPTARLRSLMPNICPE